MILLVKQLVSHRWDRTPRVCRPYPKSTLIGKRFRRFDLRNLPIFRVGARTGFPSAARQRPLVVLRSSFVVIHQPQGASPRFMHRSCTPSGSILHFALCISAFCVLHFRILRFAFPHCAARTQGTVVRIDGFRCAGPIEQTANCGSAPHELTSARMTDGRMCIFIVRRSWFIVRRSSSAAGR